MKLTKKDKAYLLEHLGHPQEDLRQLEDAFNEVSLIINDNLIKRKPMRVSKKRAIELLGRETFLGGLSRSAFHKTAERTTSDGHYSISFDLSKWW